MQSVIIYFIKLSVVLALFYLFYHLFLRKLTFYTLNRVYLLAYTALAFVFPFINISELLEKSKLGANEIVSMIPELETFSPIVKIPEAPLVTTVWDIWTWFSVVVLIGMAFLFLQLCGRLISFLLIRRGATLISSNGMKVYQVDDNIIPFSFGNSIFVNRHLHDSIELEEIIRHEFIHVKQKHSVDIIWSEILCILNWYNPAAWLLRKAIRQNLEFIADNKVLQYGIDRKQYQYLLLKVIGNNHFSIANQFNFSSLKNV